MVRLRTSDLFNLWDYPKVMFIERVQGNRIVAISRVVPFRHASRMLDWTERTLDSRYRER